MGVALLALAATASAQRARAPWELDGSDWKAMAETDKMAFLRGVIAGAAVDDAPGDRPPTPRLRFAPNVYKARLEDYYFYTDRVSTPIVRSLLLIERELLDQTAPHR